MLQFSDACERNKEPILAVLRTEFALSTTVLEIGSGTGQHAVHFARHLPHVNWQPSDLQQNLPGLIERLQLEGGDNIAAPFALDVRDDPWPTKGPYEAIYSANTLHIMDIQSVQLFFKGIGKILAPGGIVCVYGPFKYGGKYTSDSNAQFDKHLRMRGSGSGIRDFEAVDALAAAQGLKLKADYRMPANNQALVWRAA